MLVWESRKGTQGEERIKYELPNADGPANTCAADLTKALKMKRGLLVFSLIVLLNEQKNR